VIASCPPRWKLSCNFVSGDAWLQRRDDDLDGATRHLERAERLFLS